MKNSTHEVIRFHRDASKTTPAATCRRPVANPHPSTAQIVVARLGFFMLRSRYVIFPTMKAVFTTAAGALYQEARPTAIRQSQVGGTR